MRQKRRKGCQCMRILVGRDLLMFRSRANCHLRPRFSTQHFFHRRVRNIAEILATISFALNGHTPRLLALSSVLAAHPKAILDPHYCCSRTVARTSFIPLSLARSDSIPHFQGSLPGYAKFFDIPMSMTYDFFQVFSKISVFS